MISPALELAIALIAQDQSIPAYLCSGVPRDVDDIDRVRLGVGMIDGNGGMIAVDREGVAVCIAYDVKGQLVTSLSAAMPLRVHRGSRAKVGPLAMGKNGVAHL